MATVSETTRSTRITLGSLTAGPFLVGFRLFDSDGLKVFVDGDPSTAYTLTATFDDGYDDAASITFDDALPTDTVVQIDGALIPGRSDDYVNPDPGLTEKLNTELARLWAAVSETRMMALRSVRSLSEIPATDGVSGANFAEASEAANEVLLARDEVLAVEATLPDWKGTWLTATAYVFGDLVYENGSTYFCVESHTSGTFSTDLAAMKWEIFAQKGAAGTGAGDVVAANNGSEFANKATVRTNLGLAIGTNVQAYNQLLAAIAALGTNGFLVRTSGSTVAARRVEGTLDQIAVNNDDGIAANPTIAAVIASQAEAEAGVNSTKLMSALRVKQAIAALAASGRVLLASKTASASATLDFTEFNNAVYRYYEFELETVKPATDAVTFAMRFSTDAGASYDAGASDYAHEGLGQGGGGVAAVETDSANTRVNLSAFTDVGNAVAEFGVTGLLKLYRSGDPAARTRVHGLVSYDNPAGNLVVWTVAGIRKTAQDTDAVRFLYSSGTIASGTIRMYGLT